MQTISLLFQQKCITWFIKVLLLLLGNDSATLVLKENSLEPGQRYLLKLETSLDNRNGTSIVVMDIITNYLPHYGDCKVVPEEGATLIILTQPACQLCSLFLKYKFSNHFILSFDD